MTRFISFLAIAVLLVTIAGCGGAGKGVETTVTNNPPPAGNSRLIQSGDDLSYAVSGTHYDSWHSYPVTGIYHQTVLAETVTVPGTAIQAQVIKMDIVLDTLITEVKFDKENLVWTATKNGGQFVTLEEKINASERIYVSQDADGTVWTYGGKSREWTYRGVTTTGVEYWLTAPAVRYKLLGSPLAVGMGWSANVVQTDDGVVAPPNDITTFSPSFVVSTAESITVPAGTYKTYRITGNGKVAGFHGDIVQSWAPDIGAAAQFQVTSADYLPTGGGYDSRTMTLTFTLQSKSRQAH